MAGNCVLKSLFLYRFVTIVPSVHPYYTGYCTLSEVNAALVLCPRCIPEKAGINKKC